MQDKPQEKKRSALVRILALLLALIVIGGSIFLIARPAGQPGDGASMVPRALAAAATEKPWKDLKKGSSGSQVARAQQALAALGYYEGNLDGNFSKVFEAAVLSFQEDWGLEQNGVIDQDTYELITADLPEITPSPAPTPRPSAAPRGTPDPAGEDEEPFVIFGEAYSDKEHVAAYLREFGELPPNYITKQEAQKLGWVSSRGNLWQVAPGMSIGGDRYGDYEGKLPRASGRKYFECDIDFDGGYRGSKRIIYSSDGLIFYTEDHYNTFEEITE